ncbi:MAG: hypothetical protein AB7O65_12920 [Candidatus Korobacteraceae bacterium]
MADPLYLSIWFPQTDTDGMMSRLLGVMQQFPFSPMRPGIEYLAVHPVSWIEPTVLERRFRPGVDPQEATNVAADLLHEDYAYVFEAYWDLWTRAPEASSQAAAEQAEEPWVLQPHQVRFLAYGQEFDEGVCQQEGHIKVELGLDSPFLQEETALVGSPRESVRANIHKLVAFTAAVEKNCGISGRVLWSESEENLAQKLIARLQGVQ